MQKQWVAEVKTFFGGRGGDRLKNYAKTRLLEDLAFLGLQLNDIG